MSIVRLLVPTALPKLENKRHPLSNCRLRASRCGIFLESTKAKITRP
ncbi:predicted protein [Botrytis cinerea T4]|uniref:Uncharacterized protein n=1 Tax=Botryotinia fuckeliana (strain T4) TaxID=999810 RepID=G2YN53_BOTF4|nr:predicted protein [Botrytis cinerea T4]